MPNGKKRRYSDESAPIEVPPMVQWRQEPNNRGGVNRPAPNREKRQTPPGRPPQGRPQQRPAGTSFQNGQVKRPSPNNRQQRPPMNGRQPVNNNRGTLPNGQKRRPPQRPEPNQNARNGNNHNLPKNKKAPGIFNKYPWLKPFIIGFIIFLAVICIALGTDMIGGGSGDDEQDTPKQTETENTVLTENLTAGSIQGNMRQWYNAEGGVISDENVMNVLLLGVDKTDGARSDAMMLLSLNKITKKITVYSIYRDSYAFYLDNNGTEHFNKITAAYNCGPESSVKTVEKLFKIKIDGYLSVDYESFSQIIDKLGGITLQVEKYEADYINRTSHFNNFPYGESVTLKGDEALIYSRIRYSDADADVSRVRRQRKVIEAIIKKTSGANAAKLASLADGILPFIETNYTKKEVVSIGTTAIKEKWMDFEKVKESCLTSGKDGWPEKINQIGEAWIVDYPACAKKMQETLYGRSLIELQGDENTRLTPRELIEQDMIYE